MVSVLKEIINEYPELIKEHGCGLFILCLLIAIALVFVGNWIGWWLWGVIAVKIFGAPELTYWGFFGLRILLSFIIPHSTTTNTNKNDD